MKDIKYQFLDEMDTKNTEWKKEKHISIIDGKTYFLNIIVNNVTNTRIVPLIDKDLVIFAKENDKMHYITFPNNVDLANDVVASKSCQFYILFIFFFNILIIGALPALNEFNNNSFYYKVLDSLIDDSNITFILIPPVISLTSDFNNIKPCNKIITYNDCVNYNGFIGEKPKKRFFFLKKKVSESNRVIEKHFDNCYSAGNTFIVVR
jgi:hypothetical protein